DLDDQILRELLTFMMEDPHTITRAIRIIQISKYLERIGDLATNIGESVIYMVEARDIRHGGYQEKKPE
ncbi:MAG: PhoU domain-containing protein, partial [Pseudomonadota bacterium]